MTAADRETVRATRADLIASDYCHEALPFRSAELAATWAVEAWAAGQEHVPGAVDGPFAEPGRMLVVADEALGLIRRTLGVV